MLIILFILFLYFNSCYDSSKDVDISKDDNTVEDTTIIYYRCHTKQDNSSNLLESRCSNIKTQQ